MPTTVTSKIGASNTPVTMDYSTLQAWEDASPADLVSDDKIWLGECYDQGEFTGSGVQLTVSGQTVDATRYVHLRCATGASFRDKAGVRTTALLYSASNGVAARTTGSYNPCIVASTQYTRIEGMQVKITGASVASALSVTVTHCRIEGNLVQGDVSVVGLVLGGVSSGDTKFINNLAVSATALYGIVGGASSEMHGNTSVRTAAGGTSAYVAGNYSTSVIRNNAGFGYTNFSTGVGVAAGSGFNGTDDTTAVGSNNQTSLTFANQFTSATVDFRAVSTGSLDLHGTPDATNLTLDISKTTRDISTPTIGCWEVAAAATHGSRLINGGLLTGLVNAGLVA